MPQILQTTQGIVTGLWGTATIRRGDGVTRPLRMGEVVQRGDLIITSQDGIVQLTPADADAARPLAAGPLEAEPQPVAPVTTADDVERVIADLNQADPQAATAAGAGGDGAGDLTPGLRVERVVESTTPTTSNGATAITTPPIATVTRTPLNDHVSADSSTISATEEGQPVSLHLGVPPGAAIDAVVTVGQVPSIGQILKSDGSVVATGDHLAPADLPGLVYRPPADYNGTSPVGGFTYSVDSHGAAASGATTITLATVDDAPVAHDDSGVTAINAPINIDVLANDTDADGDALHVASASVDPSRGSVIVNADGTIAFTPGANVSGPVTIGYTIADPSGATSTATVTVIVGANTAPTGSGSTHVTTEDTPYVIHASDLGFHDADAAQTMAGVRFDTLPGAGTLLLNGHAVAAGQSISIADLDAGHLSLMPAANGNGAPYAAIGFSVQDSAGAFDATSRTLTLNVTPVNDAPAAADDRFTAPIDTPVTLNVLANDRDVDGDPLQVKSATLDPLRGSVSINRDDTLSFTPAANVTGPVSISYTVSDPSGATSTATATVDVGANTPPNGSDATRATAEDSPITVYQSFFGYTDTDAGQSMAGVRIDTLPAAGTLTLSGAAVVAGQVISVADLGAGHLVFTPAANANGAGYASIQFSVQDSAGAFDTAPNKLTLDVTPVNDPPVAQADRAVAAEDVTLRVDAAHGVLINDADVDVGDSKTIAAVSFSGAKGIVGSALAGTYGTLTLQADGSYTYLANKPASEALGTGQTATEQFSYTMKDAAGATSSTTLTFTITGTNDAPIAVADVASTPINAPLSHIVVLGNDSDVDGDTLHVTSAALANPSLGAIAVNADGTLNFTPSSNVTGPVTINYAIADGHGGVASSTLTVNVGANTPPAGADATRTTLEDTPYVVHAGDLGFVDTDAGQTFAAVRIDTLPGAGTLTLSGVAVVAGQIISASDLAAGHLAFTPAPNANGTGYAAIQFSVQDSAGAFDPAPNKLTFDVTPVNDPPVAHPDAATATEDITLVADAAHGVLVNDTDPDANDTKTVTTVAFGTTTGTIGSALAGTYGTLTLQGDGSYSYLANKPASEALGAGQTATEQFSYTMKDAAGATSSTTLTFTITGTNDAPIAVADVASTPINAPLSNIVVLGNDSDVDGDTLHVTSAALANPSLGAIAVNADGTLNFTPSSNVTGPVTINYAIADGHGGGASSTLTVNVGVNTPPNGADATRITLEDTPYVVHAGDLGFVDADAGQTFAAVRVDTLPGAGTLTLSGVAVVAGQIISASDLAAGHLAFTPAANANGASYAAIHFSVQDSAGAFDPAPNKLTFDVTPVNDSPTAHPDAATATEDITLVADAAHGVLVNDTDPDANDTKTVTTVAFGTTTGTIGSALAGIYGTLTLQADGSYSYLANKSPAEALAAGHTATEQFSYTMKDAAGATSSTTLTFTITGTNDAPIAVADVASTPINAPLSNIVVLGNDSDVDGDALHVTSAALANPSLGTVAINADGTLNFTPASNVSGPVKINYAIADGHGGAATSTLTVNVGANTPPAGADATRITLEDTPYVVHAGDLGFVDADAGQTFAAVRVDTLPGAGTLTLSGVAVVAGQIISASDLAAGHLAFTPAANANGASYAAIQFSVQDSAGAFDPAPNKLTFDVTPVNDPPTAHPDAATATEDITLVADAAHGVLVNDTDPDASDTKTVTAVAFGTTTGTIGSALAGTYGTLTLQGDGSYSYLANKPASEALGTGQTATEQFSYTMKDAAGATSSTTLTFTITGTNDAPIAVADVVSTPLNAPLTNIVVLGNDSDVDGDTLHVTSATLANPSLGAVAINADGTLNFTPSSNVTGPVTINYAIADGHGGVASSTLTVNVGANTPPAGADATRTTLEDTPYVVHAGDLGFVDADAGQTFAAVRIDALPSAGMLTLSGVAVVAGQVISASELAAGHLTFTPAPNANGTGYAAIQFSVQDSAGAFDPAPNKLTFDVTPVNDPPIAHPDAATATEDITLVADAAHGVLVNDTDPDASDTKTVTAVAFGTTSGIIGSALAGTYGTLTLQADGSYSYLANKSPSEALAAGQTATEQFGYTMKDAAGATSSTTLTFTITGTNDAPIAVADVASTPINAPLSHIVVLGNDSDVDGDTLHVTSAALANPSLGAIAINADGTLNFTPASNVSGPVTINYAIADGHGGTASSTLTVDVGANTPPAGADATRTTLEDTPYVVHAGDLGFVDADAGQTFAAVRIDALPGAGMLTLSGVAVVAGQVISASDLAAGHLAFTPAANANGASYAAIHFSVQDSAGEFDPAPNKLTFDVTPVNDPPVAHADAATATEDITLVADAAHGVLVNDTDPDANDTKTVTTVASGATTGTIGSALAGIYGTLTLQADGSYSYLANKSPAEALAAGQTATEQFSYTMKDAAGATSSTTLTFTITGTNDAPIAHTPGSQTVAEDTPLVFSAANGNAITVSDVDSPSLTVVLSSGNGALTLGSTAGIVVSGNGTNALTVSGSATAINTALSGASFKGTADYNGNALISMMTSDGTAAAVSSSIAVSILPVRDVHDDTATTYEGSAVAIDVGANDSFSNAGHVVTAINGVAIDSGHPVAVANGSVTLQTDGELVFTPTATFNTGNGAPTSFSYTVTSGGVAETANVDVTVVPVNNAATPTLSVTPVGRWTFNEATGTTTTDAYNAHTGTLGDALPTPVAALPTWTTGHNGSAGTALHFDGTGAYVALDAATTQPLMGTGSLTFWINTTQTGSATGWNAPAVIASEQVGTGNDIQWGTLNANGQIGFDLGNTAGVYSTTRINDATWHQVAITRDASTSLVSVYVDGHLEATGSPTDSSFTAAMNRLAGLGDTNAFAKDAAGTDVQDANFLKGDLDDVRIYDHVLTADQVAAIKSVESGYEDIAVANDGDAIKLAVAATHFTSLTVAGLNSGMVITDGTAGHSVTSGSTDSVVDLTGWNLNSLSISGAGTGSASLVFNATDTVDGESHSATQYLSIVNGTSLLAGGTGNDTLTGTAGADLLIGNAGNDTLTGGAANDILYGGAGNDTLSGGAGKDVLYGGTGNDSLTGGAGADTFAWKLADRGTAGAPATDTITDFDVAPVSAGGDTLDLRDLLIGANHVGNNPGNLANYLDFDTTSTPGTTVIHVSSTGGFVNGTYSAANEDERITLAGVDLRSSLSLGAGASDNQIIQELLTRSKLVADHS